MLRPILSPMATADAIDILPDKLHQRRTSPRSSGPVANETRRASSASCAYTILPLSLPTCCALQKLRLWLPLLKKVVLASSFSNYYESH